MTNTPMPLRTNLLAKTGAVICTGVVVTDVPSISGAKYLTIALDEACGYVTAFQLKFKGEAPELLKHQVW